MSFQAVIILLSLFTSHIVETMSNTTAVEERSFQTKKQLYYEDSQSYGYRNPTFESHPQKPFYNFPQDFSTPDLYTQPPAASVNYAESYAPQYQQQYVVTSNPYIITAPTGSYAASNPIYGSTQHSYSPQKPTNQGYYDTYVVPPAESTYDSYEPSYQGGGYEDEYSGGYGYNKGYKHPYKSYPDVEGMKKYFLFKVYGSLVKAKGALLIGVGKILKLKGKILLAKGEALEDIGYYLKDVKFNTYMSDPYGYGREDDILEDLIEKGHKHKGYKKSKKGYGFKKPKKGYDVPKGTPYVHEDSYYKRRKSGIGKSVDLLPAGSTNQDDTNVKPGSSQGPPIPLSLSNSESKEENKPKRKLQKGDDSNLTTKQSLLPTPKRARIKLRTKKIIKPSPKADSGFKPMLGGIDCDGCVEIPSRNGWKPI